MRKFKDDYIRKRSELLSEQLRIELFAFYFYMSCYQHCNNRKFALPNIANFFYKQYNEELTHAKGIIDFCNQMDIKLEYKDLKLTDKLNNIVTIFESALKYEEYATDHILKVYDAADSHKDFALTQFLDAYVQEQVQSEKEFSDYLTNAKRCPNGFELFNFDAEFKNLLKKNNKK